MNKFKIGCFFILFGWANSAYIVNLDEVIQTVSASNPSVQAAKAKYEATQKKIAWLSQVSDPWFGLELENKGQMYSLTQEFPLPTKMISNLKLAKLEANQAFQRYKRKEQEIIAQAKRLYAQILFDQRKIEAMKKTRERLDQILKNTVKNYTLGKSQQSDVLSAKIEIEQINNELLAIEDEKNSLLSELSALLNLPDSLITGVEVIAIRDTTFELKELYQIAQTQNFELKSLQTEIKKTKSLLSLAEQDYLPDLMIKFEQETMDNKLKDRKFMVGLTLPIWFWGKQNRLRSAMATEVKMVSAEYQAMENMTKTMLKQTKINLDKYQREIALYQKTILPLAEANFKSSLKAYEAGQEDLVRVLINERMLLESEIALYKAQADYLLALAELELAAGLELLN